MLDEIAADKAKPKNIQKINSDLQVTGESSPVSSAVVVSSPIHLDRSPKTKLTDENISGDESPSIEQFLAINTFQKEIQNIEIPELCSVICEPSRFEFTKGKKEPIYDVINHFNEEGSRAMSDPKFRIAYHRALAIGKVFTPKILELVKESEELEADNKRSEAEKIWLASRIVPTIMIELGLMQKNLKNAEKEIKYFKKFEELEKSCRKQSADLVVNECRKLTVN